MVASFDLLATFLLWRYPRSQHPSREAGSYIGPIWPIEALAELPFVAHNHR